MSYVRSLLSFPSRASSVALEFLRFWVPKDESSPCESILVPARVTAAESNRSHRDCGVVPGIWCRIWAGRCRISGYSLAVCSKEYSPHEYGGKFSFWGDFGILINECKIVWLVLMKMSFLHRSSPESEFASTKANGVIRVYVWIVSLYY